jgi:putative DNA primase/helicase
MYAKYTAESIAEEAMQFDGDKRKELQAHWRRSESESRLKAMVNLAATEPEIAIKPNVLDCDPLLFNVLNGTLDLRTGTLRDHDPEDFITKLAPVEFGPEATCPRWGGFLDRIFGGDEELIQFVQRAVGYSLTGSTEEQCLFLLHGRGANGKTTLIETLRALLGDYAAHAEFSTFLNHRQAQVRNDLARLAGARLVSAVEMDQGGQLSESVVKQVTGGDVVTARFLFHEFFEFRPQFKVLLAANHKPRVRGTEHAIWRRIRLVPFAVTIPEDEQDHGLLAALIDELPGILTWAVEGCLAWQQDGLGQATAVRDATGEYRREMDGLHEFLRERCVLAPEAKAGATELYDEYRHWCEEVSEKAVSRTAFGLMLAERGLEKRRSGRNGSVEWFGIELGTDGLTGTEGDSAKVPIRRDSLEGAGKRRQLSSVLQSEAGDDEPPF